MKKTIATEKQKPEAEQLYYGVSAAIAEKIDGAIDISLAYRKALR